MTRKFTIPYIEKCLSDRHIKWLNKEDGYKNRKTRMKLECITCNYVWCSQFKSIEQNKGCPKCAGCAKFTIDEVINMLTNKKIIWLNKEKGYKNNSSILKLQCLNNQCNFIWDTQFRSVIKSKLGCHRCAGREKYTPEKVNEILINKNMIWLDEPEIYQHNGTSLNIKCKICDYIFKNSLGNLNIAQQGCPKCAGVVPPTNEEILDLLKKKKIIWLDQENGYKNQGSMMSFKCEICNYQWQTSFNSIKNQDSGCAKCSKCMKYDIKFVNDFCKDKPFKVLSTEYKDAHAPLEFSCNICNYYWKTDFAHIQNRNTGCPNCSSEKTEKLCRSYLEKKLNILFPKTSAPWLNQLQLDGYNEQLNLAFEYNGLQHYKLVPFFHKTEEDFKTQQARDKLKRKILKQRGIKLLDIPYTYSCQKESKLYKFIDDQLIKLKII